MNGMKNIEGIFYDNVIVKVRKMHGIFNSETLK